MNVGGWGVETRRRKLEEDRVKKRIRSRCRDSEDDFGVCGRMRKKMGEEKKRNEVVYIEESERKRRKQNNFLWRKLVHPGLILRLGLMILISGNDTLCRQTKKSE